MDKLTIADLDVKGKRVLVRVDFNVPMKDGEITDDSRILASLPTLERLTGEGARVVLMSHLGRPRGGPDAAFSLEPVARRLAQLWGREIRFADDCVGAGPVAESEKLEDGQVLLLENLRFHKEEEENDRAFSRQLAQHGEIYVNDAFGAAHRAHASTVGVPGVLPRAAAGLLMEAELDYLGRIVQSPQTPYVAILGGAKISGKMDVLLHLMDRVDRILVGGAMTYTFFQAMGHATGASLVERDRLDMAEEVLDAAKRAKVDLLLPVDSVISSAADGSEPSEVSKGIDIPEGMIGVDIGPRTAALFQEQLADARTVVWNGPVGIFEVPPFATGTKMVADAVAAATTRGAITIVGGGDSVAALNRLEIDKSTFSHVSTGGGAFLEFLEGKELPGVAALTGRE
jgi:3-phosphoglycerate kinase